MRKLLFILLGCGLLYTALVSFTPPGRFDQFTIGKEFTIHFNYPSLAHQEFTEREKADQDRDWIMYSLVSGAGLEKGQFAQVSYDLAPVRYGFNSLTANFDYGETRSKYIGNGQVIALVPSTDEKTTNDYIAHVLDEIRKTQGEIPQKVFLFEYALNTEGNFARVSRRDNIDGKTFFTEKMGYYERPVKGTADLQAFMDVIDDITFAKQGHGNLILGGRRLSNGPYGKATPEDVAAIWQSQKALAQKSMMLKTNVNSLESEYTAQREKILTSYAQQLQSLTFGDGRSYAELPSYEQQAILFYVFSFITEKPVVGASAYGYGSDTNLKHLIADLKKESDEMDANIFARAQALKQQLGGGPAPSSSGFSLDPAIDCKRSKEFIQQHKPDFEEALTGAYTVDQVLEQLDKDNGDLMQYAIAKVSANDYKNPHLGELARKECMYQRARYDGDLKGTSAGMTLFYGDLLAKIWAANILDSHPDVDITDFRDLEHTNMQTSVVFLKEQITLSNCRLWFGPNKNGFQLGTGKKEILFARNATQIFALSHNAASAANIRNNKMVNKEVQASKDFEVVLDWWNNHYEEVGEFEHQYQRLNEIMKWSTIIGWLMRDHPYPNLATLGFLDNTPVDHSLWFPNWVKTQKDLRFTDFGKINFFDNGALGNTTEALSILFSTHHLISGGVSLADKKLLEEAPELLAGAKALARRSNLRVDPANPNAFKTFKDTKISFTADAVSKQNIVRLEPKSGMKLRSRFGEVINTKFSLGYSSEANGTYALEDKLGGLPIGKLSVGSMDGNSFTIGFEAGEVDKGMAMSREISDWQGEPSEFFRNHPDVARAVETGEDQWLVQFKESQRWILMDIDADPEINLPKGWTARVSGSEKSSHIIEIRWVTPGEVQNLLHGKALPAVVLDPIAAEEETIVGLTERAFHGDKKAAEELEKAKDQWLTKARDLETANDIDEASAITRRLLVYFDADKEVLQLKIRLDMRAALHSLSTGNPEIAVGHFNDVLATPVRPQGDEAFFKEVSNLIDQATISQEAKKKLGNFAKLYFTDQEVVAPGMWQGYKPLAKEVPLEEALGHGKVKIIYADNAAFHGIDPGAPFETAIGQIRAIPGIKVYDISGEEIGKNTRMYATIDKDPIDPDDPSDANGLNPVSKFDRQMAQLRVVVFPGSAYNDCQDRDKDRNCQDKYSVCGHVYFVTAPSLN